MVARVLHTVGTGANQFLMRLPDVYTGLGDVTGVIKVTADVPDGLDILDNGNVLASGKIFNVRISYKTGTAPNQKRKTAKLVVSADKLKIALGSLPNKTFKSQKIIGAVIPTTLTFG